jgi:pimeloyl-ACP methyl ester carboxylesterase
VTASRRSLALRRSTSEDSILYHSLARVSSFGDDDRFTHVREQVNSRFKAIRDSWDGPSFKMPQLPSRLFRYLSLIEKQGLMQSADILPTPLRKGPLGSGGFPAEISRSSSLRLDKRANPDVLSSLDAVLETLTGDIVIMGGYRGSILRSSQAPYRQLWVPVKVGLNIRKVNLEVGLDPEDEETMEDTIFSSGMLQNIGPVDISRRLFKKLRECENARKGRLRVHDFGYDWRLSPHILSRKLVEFLEKLPSNHPSTRPEQRGALVIAHSLGGLITRHAVNQRPEIFSGVVFAGTPQRCINILGPIRNGDAVLLNEKVLTAQVNFSMRTTFAMLPEDGFCFIDKFTQEEYPIDFYNVDDWIKYRLSPCVSDAPLPSLPSKSNTFGSLRSISGSLSGLPLRSRASSDAKKGHSPPRHAVTEPARTVRAEATTGGSLAPQLGGTQSGGTKAEPTPSASLRARYVTYLARTLAETRAFRAGTTHRPAHQAGNAYPPLAVVYGKDTPTVWAARVAGRQGIARVDAYDDLVFRSGDGVVLAREAMLPPGYETAKGGRVSSDHGHITMLADLAAVGRALEAVVRGRRKGIGLGEGAAVGKEG